MKSYPELVLEELQRDNTPRTSAQIEAQITAITGVTCADWSTYESDAR